MHVLIIDNYDSFTYNLYQYIGEILTDELGCAACKVTVKRNDDMNIDDVQVMSPDKIIISPGPGTPSDHNYFGICADVISMMGKTTPILGVCLGMQGIAHCFGGDIVSAPIPMHGKTSLIQHDSQGVYQDMPQKLEVMRYHSLMVAPQSLPTCLKITSVTYMNDTAANLDDHLRAGAEIMGIRHTTYPIEGIQYHPESFATEGGKQLLSNFLL
jgi:anthranilate synthase component 2